MSNLPRLPSKMPNNTVTATEEATMDPMTKLDSVAVENAINTQVQAEKVMAEEVMANKAAASAGEEAKAQDDCLSIEKTL